MNFLKSFLLFPLIVVSSLTGQVILDQSVINEKAIVIEQKITRDRYIKYGITALSVAHELYQWIPLIKDLMAPSAATEESKLSLIESFKAAFQHLFYTKAGWISLLQSGCSIGGFFIISNIGEKFIHPDTFRWYINAYAPYHITIKMMKERVAELQDQSLSQEQLEISNEILQLLYDRLIRQAELMCAFMTYKAKRLDQHEQIIAERAKVIMINSHNDWLRSLDMQLNAAERNYTTIDTLLDAYKNAIDAQVSHFALIEGEMERERRLYIKKQG